MLVNDEINAKVKFINNSNMNVVLNSNINVDLKEIEKDIVKDKTDEKKDDKKRYTITIIEEDDIKDISLDSFNKSKITFGRSEDNDIVISSLLVSLHHGYFEIENDEVKIYDNNSTNGIFVNNKSEKSSSLRDGDYVKIDNPDQSLRIGVIMIITVGNTTNKWIEVPLQDKNNFTIGRGSDCDIILNRVSVSLKHAKITATKDGHYISSGDSKSGIILNNSVLTGQELLKNKDVILINNIKLIYNNNKILYQLYDEGVRLDAIDIVKTVKIKGKNKDISQHIDFSASPGEFISFVGGSGTGKSTFLKCISGVTKPTSGKVYINGSDLFANYSVLKNLIGYVPQENIIFENLTLIDMLKYSANLRMPDDATKKEKKERIDSVLEIVELSDKKDVMIKNLSGGQKKRASIAVELLADPKLFFLDEPTSGLDPGTERSIMHTLRKMADSGKTIILVTHNTLNLHLCDKVVFFGSGGKLCFDGKPDESLNFFGVDDFVDVYNVIDDDVEKWKNKFISSDYKKNVETIEKNNIISNVKSKPKSFFKQFFTLLRRRFKTLFNNKQELLLLLGQAPIIALFFTLIVTSDLFYSYETTKSILLVFSSAGIWFGVSGAVQEVCSERIILNKEYMADLRISSYLLSKFVFLFVISLIQSILFLSAFTFIVDVPVDGLIFSWFVEMVFVMFLTIFSSSIIGIFLSIMAKDSSSASLMSLLFQIPQLIVIFPLEGMIKKIANLLLCKWSVKCFGIINDLNTLISAVQEVIPGYVREAEDEFVFTVSNLSYGIIIILLMTSIFVFGCYFLLKKKLGSDKA